LEVTPLMAASMIAGVSTRASRGRLLAAFPVAGQVHTI
jgi:hypothetical protein